VEPAAQPARGGFDVDLVSICEPAAPARSYRGLNDLGAESFELARSRRTTCGRDMLGTVPNRFDLDTGRSAWSSRRWMRDSLPRATGTGWQPDAGHAGAVRNRGPQDRGDAGGGQPAREGAVPPNGISKDVFAPLERVPAADDGPRSPGAAATRGPTLRSDANPRPRTRGFTPFPRPLGSGRERADTTGSTNCTPSPAPNRDQVAWPPQE
jgi:hypothetical protein